MIFCCIFWKNNTCLAGLTASCFTMPGGGGWKWSLCELTPDIGASLNDIGISLSSGGGHGWRRLAAGPPDTDVAAKNVPL